MYFCKNEIVLTKNDSMKNLIIDNHSHVTIPIEKHIELMNEAGIDKTILFRTNVHPELSNDETGIKKEMGKLMKLISGDSNIIKQYSSTANSELFNTVQKYPDRFYCFGIVSLDMEISEMIASIKNQIDKYHILGLGEFTLSSGTIPKMENIFKASSQANNLPIWIHGFNPLTLKDIIEIEKLAKNYPTVPVIIGHAGGSYWLETIDIVKRNTNIYLDISASFSSMALKIIINELPDKTFFGVDYPYGDMWLMKKMVERVCNNNEVLHKVLGGNIATLLQLY